MMLMMVNIMEQVRFKFNEKFFTGENMYEGWNFNSGNYLFTTDTK